MADYDQAALLNPEMAEIYLARGNLYLSRGDDEQALTDLTRCLQLRPDFGQAYLQRAAIYAGQERYAEALADVEQAHRLKPDDPEIKRALAMVQEARRRQQR